MILIKILQGRKHFLFIALIAGVMTLPGLTGFPGIDREGLKGAYVWKKDSALTLDRWINGNYQSHKEQVVRENFPMHPFFIRCFAQLQFVLFKKATAKDVIVGNDNYLYEQRYIDAFNGKDFAGKAFFTDFIAKLKKVKDTLQKQNKSLLLVIAPGKVTFFPEYLPEKSTLVPAVSNYLYLISALNHHGLPHIDFNAYFQSQKRRSPYPLFPQYGVHWSVYGSLIAFDSICRYLESDRNINLPDLEFKSIKLSESQGTDNDLIAAMNLLWEPPTFQMAYPEYEYRLDTLFHTRPRLLAVADSFWWFLYGNGIPQTIFSQHRFWYYNYEAYPQSATVPISPTELDLKKEIDNTDVLLIVYNESNLYNPGSSIVDQLYKLFFGKRPHPVNNPL